MVQSIAQSKLSVKDQDTLVEICVLLHQRYEDFASKLAEALEKLFNELGGEFTRKRNILRLMSELYLRGLIREFKGLFKCINQMTLVGVETLEEFQNALMVLTDYLKTYGEVFFQILPKQRREAIEVTLSAC